MNTTARGINALSVDTSFRPTLTSSTFSPEYIRHRAIGKPPLRRIGRRGRHSHRLDVFNGDIYLRGNVFVAALESSLEVWKDHQLWINRMPITYTFRYVPRVAHGIATSDSNCACPSRTAIHLLQAALVHFYTTCILSRAASIALTTSDASSYVLETALNSALELPGIGAVHTVKYV